MRLSGRYILVSRLIVLGACIYISNNIVHIFEALKNWRVFRLFAWMLIGVVLENLRGDFSATSDLVLRGVYT